MKLVTRSQTSAILRKSGFRVSRDLGQNFLVDENILRKILDASELKSDEVVLEIGTGIGTLTEALAKRVREVITIEIDKRLVPILSETLSGISNVKMLSADALRLEPSQTDITWSSIDKIVSNLPYSVAAPAILKYFSDFKNIKTMIVMVQREIAERILAEPGSKNYSAFTVKLRYFCQGKKLSSVSRHSFLPEPNVDSMVIKLARWEKPPVETEREQLFQLITAGFSQRRKQLVNSVVSVMPQIDKGAIESALEALGKSRRIRAENLTLQDFAELAEKLVG